MSRQYVDTVIDEAIKRVTASFSQNYVFYSLHLREITLDDSYKLKDLKLGSVRKIARTSAARLHLTGLPKHSLVDLPIVDFSLFMIALEPEVLFVLI